MGGNFVAFVYCLLSFHFFSSSIYGNGVVVVVIWTFDLCVDERLASFCFTFPRGLPSLLLTVVLAALFPLIPSLVSTIDSVVVVFVTDTCVECEL